MADELINPHVGLSEDAAADAFQKAMEAKFQKPPAPEGDEEVEDTDSEAPETAEAEEVVEENSEEPQPDADAEETEEQEQPATSLDPETLVSVKIDGKDEEVSLKEALAGYSRTASYTRNMQALREEQRTWNASKEPEYEQFRQERAQYVDRLSQLATLLEGQAPQEPDWAELERTHPEEFPKVYARYQLHKQRVQAVKAEQQAEESRLQREYAVKEQERMEGEWNSLLKAFPAWADEGARKEAAGKLRDYAVTLGFPADALSEIRNHLLFVVLDKARLYDEAKAKAVPVPAPKAKGKTTPALKPGSTLPETPASRQTSDVTRAKQRLAKTGRGDDAAVVFDNIMKNRGRRPQG